jgi:hypothetical protein
MLSAALLSLQTRVNENAVAVGSAVVPRLNTRLSTSAHANNQQ